ncbi:MAG: hypothetical protein AABY58_06365 [Nitrospirota bacterium]
MKKQVNGKKVINACISEDEYNFLKKVCERHSMTVTMYLRNLIRTEMKKSGDLTHKF